MDFDDEKSVVIAVGAGHGGGGVESNKQMDLCPQCFTEVEKFVETGLMDTKKVKIRK